MHACGVLDSFLLVASSASFLFPHSTIPNLSVTADLKNGFGFAYFSDLRDAEDSVKALNGVEFHGKRLRVEVARGTTQQYICNCSLSFSPLIHQFVSCFQVTVM